jgi:hypothetical protein
VSKDEIMNGDHLDRKGLVLLVEREKRMIREMLLMEREQK